MRTKALPKRSRITASVAAALALVPQSINAQEVLSEFAGSTLMGTYESEFDRLAYATELSSAPDVQGAEGRFLSRIFEKPQGKSNREVLRSYQTELERGGFDVHLASSLNTPMSWQLKLIYDPPHTSFAERRYEKPDGQGVVGALDLAFVTGAAEQYMVASRTAGGEERWVAVLLSGSRPFYMVEEVTVDAMETGTVTLNLEAMRTEIEASGKIAVYDIHFATGSAVIEPESAAALQVIATYLNEISGRFYIVGHTDDTGSLGTNMGLSDQRAGSVKQALVDDYGIDAGRLETRGVGPLSPVSTNIDDDGRALNRRVEIVQRLP
jgi:outer membrane protein OmpA-like peptidoglycan-associated protein